MISLANCLRQAISTSAQFIALPAGRDLNLSYERGNTLMFGFTLRTNFNDLRPALRDTPKPAYQPAPESEGLQYTTVANQLTALKYNAGFDAPEIQLRDKTLYMSGQQYKYRDSREAVDRANRILVNNLPQGVEKISVTQKREHMAMVTTETDVASLRKQLAGTAPWSIRATATTTC